MGLQWKITVVHPGSVQYSFASGKTLDLGKKFRMHSEHEVLSLHSNPRFLRNRRTRRDLNSPGVHPSRKRTSSFIFQKIKFRKSEQRIKARWKVSRQSKHPRSSTGRPESTNVISSIWIHQDLLPDIWVHEDLPPDVFFFFRKALRALYQSHSWELYNRS
jgi:hypothetical protein